MDVLNLKVEGRHHSGIDDTRNIARCALKLIQGGYIDYGAEHIRYVKGKRPKVFIQRREKPQQKRGPPGSQQRRGPPGSQQKKKRRRQRKNKGKQYEERKDEESAPKSVKDKFRPKKPEINDDFIMVQPKQPQQQSDGYQKNNRRKNYRNDNRKKHQYNKQNKNHQNKEDTT